MPESLSGVPAGPRTSKGKTGPLLVSIVIVSWNVRDLLRTCLQSVVSTCSGVTYEVIVVDNASNDGTAEMLRTEFPWVRLEASGVNLGFARGNNRGFALARGRYVFILNPDTQLQPGTLTGLLERMRKDDSIGMVGPMLRSPNGGVQGSCARRAYNVTGAIAIDVLRLNYIPVLGPKLVRALRLPYDFDKTQDVEAISGAAMLVKRSVLMRLGGFGEQFPYCGEDLALCNSIHRDGRRIEYLATSVVVHHQGASSRQAIARTSIQSFIANYILLKSTKGWFEAALYRGALVLLKVPILSFKLVLRSIMGRLTQQSMHEQLRLIAGIIRWKAPQ